MTQPRYHAIVLTVTATVLLAAQPVLGLRKDNPFIIQVTHNTVGGVSAAKLRSERAENIVFASDGDVTGPPPGHREIYMWNTSSRVTSRVTYSGSGESYSPSRSTDTTQTSRPEYVAFVSTADLDPSVGNADGNPEVFLWELLSGEFKQLSDTLPPVVNDAPYPSDSGRCMVFTSTGDLDDNAGTDPKHQPTGWSNIDGSQEVFIFMVGTDNRPVVGTFTQVSNAPAGASSWAPVVGDYYFPRQCQQTFYLSDHDQLSNGSTGTNIYRFKRNSGLVDQMKLRAKEHPVGLPTGTPGAPVLYGRPAMSGASRFATGPYAVYSTADDVINSGSTGENVYKYRIQHPRTWQYTAVTAPFYARSPVVSDGGKWIAFESNAELISDRRKAKDGGTWPFNADGNQEIFRTQGRRRIQQITQTTDCESSLPTIQDTGMGIAFRSTCDLVPGHNPSGLPQIFYYAQVADNDPLLLPGACLLAEGCCGESNGCYQKIGGRNARVPKKNCLSKKKGC